MNEPPQAASASHLPWGFLGTLVILAGVEAALARHDLELSNPAPLCWRFAREAAPRGARDSAILCLGTSLVKNGLLPCVLERRTGHRAFNLAVFSGSTASSYFLLKRAIEAGAHPYAIVVDCQDGPLPQEGSAPTDPGLWINVRQWPELASPRESLDLAWSARDPALLAVLTLSGIFPSVKARFEIRNAIVAALGGDHNATRKNMEMLLRNWSRNQGAQVLPARGPGEESLRPSQESGSLRAPARSRNRLCEEYALRLVSLAESQGIKVFWLLPPLGPDKQHARERDGSDDYFTQLARAVQARASEVVVIDARRSGYRHDEFWDDVHLNRLGALALSAEVSEVVAAHLGTNGSARGWVNLSHERPPMIDVPLEDVFESSLAVKAFHQGLRR